jgi:hypothetical protein
MTHRYTFLSALVLLSACAGPEFESGEAAVCLGSDATTPIPVTAKATWEVTGMVTAVRDFDAADEATTNCGSNISSAVDIVDVTGTTWTLGYGILDSKGEHKLPELDLAVDDTVNLTVRQSDDGMSRGFVIHDGQGIVAAMDEGTAGGALKDDDLDGLEVRRGFAIGTSKDDCGKMEGTQITFKGSGKSTSSPFGSTMVNLEGTELEAFAIDSFYWTDSACDDALDQLTWAIFR